jgi:nicotinate-nucleotide adenylyltransferase
MKRLILGGSFNPIHHGHLICARAVAEQLGFQRLTLIPTGQPPHKPGSATLASPDDRLNMTRLAIEKDPLFEVNDLELQRQGPTYTLDTVRELVAAGANKVHWLIGADMLMYLPKWHKPLELLREVHFVVIARPGWEIDWAALPPDFRHLRDNVVEAPLIDIRASDIRARIAAGKPIRYLTPDAVCDYIEQHRLYA